MTTFKKLPPASMVFELLGVETGGINVGEGEPNERHFISLDALDGELKERMEGGRISAEEALEIKRQAADAGLLDTEDALLARIRERTDQTCEMSGLEFVVHACRASEFAAHGHIIHGDKMFSEQIWMVLVDGFEWVIGMEILGYCTPQQAVNLLGQMIAAGLAKDHHTYVARIEQMPREKRDRMQREVSDAVMATFFSGAI